MTLKSHAKSEKKLTCDLENDMRSLANFHQNTWKCQNWFFHGILLSKVENAWASTYRGVMCNDTEEWWKIWRGIDLLFQNWHKEFDEFWFENLKVSKIYTLMRCFWPKYIMFELKSTQESCLMVLNIDAKFEGKLTCAFKNDMRNLANCQQSMFESLNTGTFIGYFYTK